MDERLRFVARLLEGEKMAPLCAESASPAKRAIRFSIATRTAASRRSMTAAGARTAKRIGNQLPDLGALEGLSPFRYPKSVVV